MNKPRIQAAGALLALSVALSGCISLFPKAPPVQTYRFGMAPAAAPPSATGQTAQVNVLRSSTTFDRAAQGDTILTTTGDQTAYIGGGRWVAPAVVLFDEAVADAFSAPGDSVRLISRGEMASSTINLKLSVQTFEARYSGEKNAAPVVVVRVRAELLRMTDRKVLGDRTFESRKPVEDNRIEPIVRGFNDAVTDVLGQLVSWTQSQTAGG